MKAVLEFQYPEDEQNLLYALRGAEMYKALDEVRALIKGSLDTPSTPMTVKTTAQTTTSPGSPTYCGTSR